MVYFDYAAATPVDDDVFAAMQPYYTEKFYNPSATYLPGRSVRNDLEEARAKTAKLLGVRPTEIIFTAGGTEANNLAVQGIMTHPALVNSNCSVTVSGIEHDSVLNTAKKFNCFVALTTEQGRVNLEDLRSKISDETVLVSVMYANNEVGSIQPLRQIALMIQEVKEMRRKKGSKTPLYFHTDACQAPNYLDIHVKRLGVDLMTLNGGKIYGPKQSGILYVANHVQLAPLVIGGGQERGLRSGTENVAQSVGFAAALEKTLKLQSAEITRLSKLQQMFFDTAKKELPQVVVNGSKKHRLPNNIHVTIPATDNETLMMQLEKLGFLVAVGSACSASSEEPSHVLTAMGFSDNDAQSSLRITFGRQTTQEQVNELFTALKNLLKTI